MTRKELLGVAKPILFNTEMVRAILEGRKTCTRRIIKPKSRYACGIYVTKGQVFERTEESRMWKHQKPLYNPGDVMYVRETWSEWTGGYLYKAWPGPFPQPGGSAKMTWHPSLHMPKEAARIFLRVTDVRVERLQEITPEQAICEGTKETFPPLAVDEFRDIWNSTVDKKDTELYGWDANPWVWVYEFERIAEEP